MNGYIKESNRGGVYNRLYLDSTVRKKKLETLEKKITNPVNYNKKSKNIVIIPPKKKIEPKSSKNSIREENKVAIPRTNSTAALIDKSKKISNDLQLNKHNSQGIFSSINSPLSTVLIPEKGFFSSINSQKSQFYLQNFAKHSKLNENNEIRPNPPTEKQSLPLEKQIAECEDFNPQTDEAFIELDFPSWYKLSEKLPAESNEINFESELDSALNSIKQENRKFDISHIKKESSSSAIESYSKEQIDNKHKLLYKPLGPYQRNFSQKPRSLIFKK